MAKKLIHTQKFELERTQEEITNLKSSINELLKKYSAIPGAAVTKDDLAQVIQNPEAAYKAALMAKIPSEEYGLPVNKELKLSLLTLPVFTEVNELAEVIKSQGRGIDYLSGVFELDGADKVKINKDALERILDRFRVYATNSKEEQFVELHKAFIKAFNEFKDFSEKTFVKAELPQFQVKGFSKFDMNLFINDNNEMNINLFNVLKEKQA